VNPPVVKVYGEYAGRLPESDPAQRQRLPERWEKGDHFSSESATICRRIRSSATSRRSRRRSPRGG